MYSMCTLKFCWYDFDAFYTMFKLDKQNMFFLTRSIFSETIKTQITLSIIAVRKPNVYWIKRRDAFVYLLTAGNLLGDFFIAM